MTATKSPTHEYIVLYGVPWEVYVGIDDALAGCRFRHTYDQGALEMPRVVYDVAWASYLEFLDATADFKLRHTYDEGTLEMMSPRKDHDWVAKVIARMIEAFTLAMDIPIQSIGSTTLQASKGGRGVQPDETYYLTKEPRVRCKDTYEPGKDPPPDLAVEVEVTRTCLPRLPVFAAIGIREVWRVDRRGRARFYRLNAKKKEYEPVERSIAFPFLKPADLMRFVKRRTELGETAVVREFVDWATEKAKAK